MRKCEFVAADPRVCRKLVRFRSTPFDPVAAAGHRLCAHVTQELNTIDTIEYTRRQLGKFHLEIRRQVEVCRVLFRFDQNGRVVAEAVVACLARIPSSVDARVKWFDYETATVYDTHVTAQLAATQLVPLYVKTIYID